MRFRWQMLLALLVPCFAQATMVTALDLTSLIDRSERIVVAHVEGQQARWTAGHDRIYTDVTLRVVQPLKDAPGGLMKGGDRVVVRREGGEVDGIGMLVAGAATFTDNEDVVVFLERRGASLYTVGMSQGKMAVRTIDGRRMAIRNNGGLGFIGDPPPEPPMRPLDELVHAVAARVGRTR